MSIEKTEIYFHDEKLPKGFSFWDPTVGTVGFSFCPHARLFKLGSGRGGSGQFPRILEKIAPSCGMNYYSIYLENPIYFKLLHTDVNSRTGTGICSLSTSSNCKVMQGVRKVISDPKYDKVLSLFFYLTHDENDINYWREALERNPSQMS